MQDDAPPPDEPLDGATAPESPGFIPPDVARRLGALLFVVVFLLDVLGNPELLLAARKLCGL